MREDALFWDRPNVIYKRVLFSVRGLFPAFRGNNDVWGGLLRLGNVPAALDVRVEGSHTLMRNIMVWGLRYRVLGVGCGVKGVGCRCRV